MTATITSSWMVGVGTPGATVTTTLVNVGQLSEALPPLLLSAYEAPLGNDYSGPLGDAISAGFDRILIEGVGNIILKNVAVDKSCELIFAPDVTVSPYTPANNSGSFQTNYLDVTAPNVTIRGLNAQGQSSMYIYDTTAGVTGSGAIVYCELLANPGRIANVGITVVSGGYYTTIGMSPTAFSGTTIYTVYDNWNATGTLAQITFTIYNGVMISGAVTTTGTAEYYSDTSTSPPRLLVGRAYPNHAIDVSGADGFTLLDSTFAGGGAAVVASGVQHMRILRCQASGFGPNGASNTSTSALSAGVGFSLAAATDCWIGSCHAEGGQAAAIPDATQTTTAQIGAGFRIADTAAPAQSSNLMFTDCIADSYGGGSLIDGNPFGGNGFDGTVVDLTGATYLACIGRNNYGNQFSLIGVSGATLGVSGLQYVGCTGVTNIDGFALGSFLNGTLSAPNGTPFELFVEGGAYAFETGTDNNSGSIGFSLAGLSNGCIAPNISWATIGIQLNGVSSDVRIRPQALFAKIGIDVPSGTGQYPREMDLSGSKINATAVGIELEVGSNPILDDVQSVVEGRRIASATVSGTVSNPAVTATLGASPQTTGKALPLTGTAGLVVGARVLSPSGFPSNASIASINGSASIAYLSTPVTGTFTQGEVLTFEAILPVYVNGGGIGLVFGQPVSGGQLTSTPMIYNGGVAFLGGGTGTAYSIGIPGVNPADPGTGGLVNIIGAGGTVTSATVAAIGANYLSGGSGTFQPQIGAGADIQLAVGGASPRVIVANGGYAFFGTPAFNYPSATPGPLTFVSSLDISYGLRMNGVIGGQISNGKFQGVDAAIEIDSVVFGPMITGVTAIGKVNTPINLSSGAYQGDGNSLVTSTPALPIYTIASNAITIGGNLVHIAGSANHLYNIFGAISDGQVIFISATSGTVTLTGGGAGNLLVSGGSVPVTPSQGPLMLQWNASSAKWLQVAPSVTDS